jgi:pimeloyl-ACP methyl ester carboxylesterase
MDHHVRPDLGQRTPLAGVAVTGAPVGGASAALAQTPQRPRRIFVLVHGAWHGGWCWRRLSDRLTAAGHLVFTPTLTGVGERVHLLNPNINLDTHIADIVSVMKWEDLTDVVLCGHSYAGCVITGVAEKMESAISSIVYLDAFMPENGQALSDLMPPEHGAAIVKAAQEGQALPARSAAAFAVNEKDRAWVDAKCTPHPAGTFAQKVVTTGARDRIGKKAYVLAEGYPGPFRPLRDKLAATPGWRTYELPCGHDIMVDIPDRLAEILQEVA